jgi:hypothetical protein
MVEGFEGGIEQAEELSGSGDESDFFWGAPLQGKGFGSAEGRAERQLHSYGSG